MVCTCRLGGLAVDPLLDCKTRSGKTILRSLLADRLRQSSVGWRALSKLEIEFDDILCVCGFSSEFWRSLSGRGGVGPSSIESTPLRESFVLLLPDKLRETPGESEYTDDTLAIDVALASFSFFTSPPAPPPTGRRGIAMEPFAAASLGKGGRSVLKDFEVNAAGDFSVLAEVSPGGTGSTFENLERPLPGVDGKGEYIFGLRF